MTYATSLEDFQYKIIGKNVELDLRPYQPLLDQINALGPAFEKLTTYELLQAAQDIRTQLSTGGSMDSLLPRAFALIREACQRELGMRPYDTQILAAIVLQQGKLAELKTGEGKTLAAVLPACLHALAGQNVHILTFNDYLAKRDATWMEPVYRFMGLTVGYVQEDMTPEARRTAYACDITYTTAKQVGFDYLRSFIAYTPAELILPPFQYAIVDEADALLIDEGRNPLVLAGRLGEIALDLTAVDVLVKGLEKEIDFMLDDYKRNIFLTDQGISAVEKHFGIKSLHDEEGHLLLSAVNLALHAQHLLHREVDYIVRDEQVKLIDEFTGRIVEDRKWQNGLQAAVEAKEKLSIQSEGSILGSISIQHFIHHYPKIAGMTATAQQAAAEFHNFYGLRIVAIPPHIPSQRVDLPDLIFATKKAKETALVSAVKTMHATGRPILIGTLTVLESEALATLLQLHGVPCHVLNAKHDAKESAIVAQAGTFGAVTISTNMAGRGTDIVLGGKDGSDRERIVALGGLHIIGTNKHESARIDDQLRGRAGRQGDPGSSQFIVSLEDDLMAKYKLKELLPKRHRNVSKDSTLTHPIFSRKIDQAQRVIEGQMYDTRRTLFEYSAFIENQRQLFLGDRQQLLLAPPKSVTHYLLNQYDQRWAAYLSEITQMRESIHLVRIGGEEPLRIFHQHAAERFRQLQEEMQAFLADFEQNQREVDTSQIKRPSSTWTYVISDNPFKKDVGMMLLSSGNMGFQIDFLTLPFLAIVGLVRKIRRAFRK